MANGDEDFDELDIKDDTDAITFMETNIEQQAKEIQLIKNPDGAQFKFKGLVKF